MPPISRGFTGRPRSSTDAHRIPPGQYLTSDFPVLSAGPTPRIPQAQWSLTLRGKVEKPTSWSWEEFLALPSETFTVDIHCVTKWSKLDTRWAGVSIDTLLEQVGASGKYVMAWSEGGYTTNLPVADLTGGKAWIAHTYDGKPLDPEHGGPARLLVPHLYFWKSAKWVRGLEVRDEDEAGFWESNGYHIRGDPWQEQRYWGD
jgi:DMSO/TMAO reductase YedYZ molybdopterin-dependent catalytic subunit